MKRTLAWVMAAAMVLPCLTGCAGGSGNAETSAMQRLGDSFSVEMTMEIDDMQGSGTVYRYGASAWRVQFAAPDTLAGVVLDFSGCDVTASYQGLAFSVPQAAMPAKSVLLYFILTVDELAQQETITGETDGETILVEGELDGNPYCLTLTQDGALAGFEMDSMTAMLSFTQFQSGAVSTATATTTAIS